MPHNSKSRGEDDRTGMSVECLRQAFLDHLCYSQGIPLARATPHDCYMAVSYLIRDRLAHRAIQTMDAFLESRGRAVFYLSAEFLLGRQLANNVLNIGCWDALEKALAGVDVSLQRLIEEEPEPGLGNGGLGRLAACYLDSLSTLEVPALGYGIRYQFGMFRQRIIDGWQIEQPDQWLNLGNPWEVCRPEARVEVGFGGTTEWYYDERKQHRVRWVPSQRVYGIPYDTMVPGYGTKVVNTLRLWHAQATEEFDFSVFNSGDYFRAVERKIQSETISRILYPNELVPQGRDLRLRQQYFFVSSSLQDIFRAARSFNFGLDRLASHGAVQLNDTHPSIAVAECMRLLVDEESFSWEDAWEVTRNFFGYTNHTLLSEALERWPVEMMRRILPRHLQIIFEINERFLKTVRDRFPGDDARVQRMSIIEEGAEQQVRMAHLAAVGSRAINGVAALHTDLLKQDVLRDFYELWPEKFSNKTNGVTLRRWLLVANPRLTQLISSKIGSQWLTSATDLSKLEPQANDPAFQRLWMDVKRLNKERLAEYISKNMGISVDPSSLFDVQVKRIHEYKRQLLCALHVIALYNELKMRKTAGRMPRTVIFGGKSAPAYLTAKLIIKLINSVADVVNADPETNGLLKVVFLENFCVSTGELVYPAADLSEQISCAGKEASGTGNMKFALNGALTIGTLDGANIEMRQAVGADNFFLFGHTVEQLKALRENRYAPREYLHNSPELCVAIEQICAGHFSRGFRELFLPLMEALLNRDEYFSVADFPSYFEMQRQAEELYKRPAAWARASILNTARMGYFSSDRATAEYCREIWKVEPLKFGSA